MIMGDINDVRLAWIRRRMTIRDKASGNNFGNEGTLVVLNELDCRKSNFTYMDLARSVSSLAVDKRWEDMDGFGVTEPNCVPRGKPKDLVKIADLVDRWMLGL